MTVAIEDIKAGPYEGDGVKTDFDFDFKTLADTDVAVYHLDANDTETLLVKDTGYTITLNADQNGNPGGSITKLGAALPAGEFLTLVNEPDFTQSVKIRTESFVKPSVMETMIDRVTILAQRAKLDTARSLKMPVSWDDTPVDLPFPKADNILMWNDALDGFRNVAATAVTLLDQLRDADNDTKIWVEKTPDDDTIRFDAAGAERGDWTAARLRVQDILEIHSADNTLSALHFGDPEDADVGRITYDHTTDVMKFFAAGTNIGEANNSKKFGPLEVISTSGDTSRTLADRFDDVFNVKDFGAVGDGVTDDATSIQAAVDAAEAVSGGGIVFFPRGDYLVETTVTVDASGVVLEGQGRSSRIVNGTTNTPTVTFGDGTNTRNRNSLFNLTFGQKSGVTAVSGNIAINIQKCASFRAHNIFVFPFPAAPHVGITISNTSASFFSNIHVQDCLSTGIVLDNFDAEVGGIHFDRVRSDANGGNGIHINDLGGFYAVDVACYNNDGQAWRIGNVTPCKNMFFLNCVGDTSGSYNWLIEGLNDAVFSNCWGSTQQDDTVNTFADGFFFQTSVNRIRLVNCVALNNNNDGFAFTTGADDISVINVNSRNNGQSAGSGYGLNNGSATNIKAIGGSVSGNATGGINNFSSNFVHGHTTENSGTGSIASGSTSDVITHGLSVTPAAKDIRVILTENPTNDPGNIWVDTITSTQFTVNCRNDPGASNLDFEWQAIVL